MGDAVLIGLNCRASLAQKNSKILPPRKPDFRAFPVAALHKSLTGHYQAASKALIQKEKPRQAGVLIYRNPSSKRNLGMKLILAG
jgi:hypothetical protein